MQPNLGARLFVHSVKMVTRRMLCAVLGLMLICAGGCAKASATPTSPTTTPQTPDTTGVIAGCEVGAASDGLPMVSDPKSPYYDTLGVAFSGDGASVTGFQESLAHASAPDAARLPSGGVGVYYNSGETGGIWLARLMGTGLTPVSAITVNGVLRPRWMADVNVELVGGKVRMIYLNGDGGSRRFCVAESIDGVSFTIVALAIRFSGTEADPTVVQLPNGTWLMAFSRANHTGIGFARSGDGLSYTEFASASFGVVPELALTTDGRVRLYVCAGEGVASYTSADSGATWQREGLVIAAAATGRRIVCDPTALASAGIFVFKTTDAM